MPFFIIFVVIPIVELAIFAAISDEIGIWTALLFALLTAVIGGNVVRLQGLQTIASMQRAANQGRIPLSELFDGFCLVAAGALLITPGFLTDTIGFLLLVPAARDFLRHIIKTHTQWGIETHGFGNEFEARRPLDPDVIEGEYETLDDDKDTRP